MKILLAAVTISLSLTLCSFAAGPTRQIEWTVTYKDGTKSQVTASFNIDEAVSIPVYMNTPSMCVLTFSPEWKPSTTKEEDAKLIGLFSIRPVSTSGEVTDKPIFSALLPVTLGQEIKLLEMTELTVTVNISSPENKK